MKRDKIVNIEPDILDGKRAGAIAMVWCLFFFFLISFDWSFLVESKGNVQLTSIRLVAADPIVYAVTFMACAIGAAIAAVLHPLVMWSTLGLVIGAVLMSSASFLSLDGIPIWHIMPALAILCTGGSTFVYKEVIRKQLLSRLEASMELVVPQESLKLMLEDPDSVELKDRNTFVTAITVNIVGLRTIQGRYQSEELFREMRDLYKRVRVITHHFGGVVLRSWRDGFTIIFGDQFRKDSTNQFHAEFALQCAAELQKQSGLAAINAAQRKAPVFCLRVGVASGRVAIGNLGVAQNLDFFPFGEAIEEARMLERAAEVNNILFTRATRDLLTRIDPKSKFFVKRHVAREGDKDDLIEVYDFDPFHDNAEMRKQVINALRESAKLERMDERHAINRPELFRLATNHGDGTLVNISRGGMAVNLDKSLANGTIVRVRVESADDMLMTRLNNREVTGFNAEIRWSRAAGHQFMHGLSYKSLTSEDRDFLLQILLEAQDRAGHSVKVKAG